MERNAVPGVGVLLLATALASGAGAQEGRIADPVLPADASHRNLHARRITTPPRIDGVLDDEVWAEEPLLLGDWVTYNPMRGMPADERTSVWVVYDDRALYFAFRCLDPQPERIRTTVSRRDGALSDDWVGLSLDSSAAGQLAYHLFVNPSGIQMDALNSGANGEDFAPDWVWQSAGHLDPGGWSAEIRLPLENIRFHSGSGVRMGVLFWRRLSRSGVSSSWPEMSPGKWVFESHARLMFDDLRSRRLLEVIPSSTLSQNRIRALTGAWSGVRSNGDVGASVKYGLSSSVVLDATVNPDFSQVESDTFEVQVNQRFPIFVNEKRPFFMEGLGLFNLAGTGNDASMRTAVHTRRIVDPSAGIKVTGTAGRQTFGLLSSPDASPAGQDQRFFTIARHVVNFGSGQYLGALLTDTEFAAEHNRVAGGDFVLRRGNAFRWNGSILSSHTGTAGGDSGHGIGSQLSYSYNTRRWSVMGQTEHYDRGFRMDTAFLNRVGITRGWQYEEINFYPTPSRYGWVKRIAPFVWIAAARDRIQGGTEAYYLPGIRMNFTRAGSVRLDYGRGHETFAGQRFETGQASINGSIQATRWLNVGGSASTGPAIFYDPAGPFQGDRTSATLRVGLQPNTRVNSSSSYSFVTFTSRRTGLKVFDVHIVNLRQTYHFTPHFFVRSVEQFDSSQTRVLCDFLASYELSPGTVFYAGYGSLLERAETRSYRASAQALFLKASYLVRF